MKRALITGVTGQDGAYLSHLLLKKENGVHDIKEELHYSVLFYKSFK